MDNNPLPTGSMIGILGGGQLGRMLALAAAKLGMRTHIYCPDKVSPAFEITPHKTVAAYENEAALAAFAKNMDVVTYEFENVPAATANYLSQRTRLAPDAKALEVSQDRLLEKQFLADNNIAIAPFAPVNDSQTLQTAIAKIGLPAVIKTTRFGYDGKGQHTLRTQEDADQALLSLTGQQLVLEKFVPFDREISVIVARNAAGQTRAYDPAENVHTNHILHTSTVPASIGKDTLDQATTIACTIVDALDYCGVMGIEFFVSETENGTTLLVNEIAPRVHNSGHWTEAVCVTDQFEQHIRAICNWPLGPKTRMADVTMENLIGDDITKIPLNDGSAAQPHVYGKLEARVGRKMGHINHVQLTNS